MRSRVEGVVTEVLGVVHRRESDLVVVEGYSVAALQIFYRQPVG
jgi:hypothetical protein